MSRRAVGLVALLLAAALAITACGAGPRTGTKTRSSPAASSGSVPTTGPSSPGTAPADWPAYDGGGEIGGAVPGGRLENPRRAWQTDVHAPVWGSPIVADGLAIVATVDDTVYAFDARTGRPAWSRHLASPVSSSTLPCGDVTPTAGIISTPIADIAGDRLYVVAFERPGRHVLYTLQLKSGAVLGRRGVDPPGESPRTEQQRGALALANGYLYVPFGGLDGDCGTYHGWIIGVPLNGGALARFSPPGCPNECGFWAPGGPTIAAAGGDVWVADGNSDGSASRYDSSDTVFRLSPGLKLLGWFAPSNWLSLSRSDLDLGSTSPVLLTDGLVWISGKEGRGYLVRQGDLGGIGRQVAEIDACPSYSSAVATGSTLYLSCWGPGEIMALRINARSPGATPIWHRDLGLPGGPIVADGALWVIDTASGSLDALNPRTGARTFSLAERPAEHFATPAAAGTMIYAAFGRRLVAIATA